MRAIARNKKLQEAVKTEAVGLQTAKDSGIKLHNMTENSWERESLSCSGELSSYLLQLSLHSSINTVNNEAEGETSTILDCVG